MNKQLELKNSFTLEYWKQRIIQRLTLKNTKLQGISPILLIPILRFIPENVLRTSIIIE